MTATPAASLRGRPIRALLFDYGLTLITYDRPADALLRAYEAIVLRLRAAGLEAVPPAALMLREVHDRIEEAVAAHEAAGDLSEIDLVALERRAYGSLGLTLSDHLLEEIDDAVQHAWWEGVVVPPGTVRTLEELRRRGLRLGLCSNAPYRSRSLHAQLRHLRLDRHLDSVTFSSEVGWRKPSPRIFAAALEALGVEAEQAAMIGDRRHEDIAGARALGMTTIRVREHRDDPGPDDADVVIDTVSELVALLFGKQEWDKRGSVVGDDTSTGPG